MSWGTFIAVIAFVAAALLIYSLVYRFRLDNAVDSYYKNRKPWLTKIPKEAPKFTSTTVNKFVPMDTDVLLPGKIVMVSNSKVFINGKKYVLAEDE